MNSFRPDADVLARRVGDEVVLVHGGRNEIFALNTTGARLWELLSEGRTRAEAVQQLTTEFDVTEEAAAQEADALLDRLVREGLIHGEGS
jgi:hypothetical protein